MKWTQRTPVRKYREDDHILQKLANVYGIDNINEFLRPTKKSLHSPKLLKNADKACEKLINALKLGKTISIYADIDADGITSCAIMYNYLKLFTNNIRYFHAQRSDGHGIKVAIDLIPEDTDLLLIVDSSTSDGEACKIISEKGIDIVILDHHPQEEPNDHALIVNPQLDSYPNKNLSGAGVCLKVCQYLDQVLKENISKDLVDLAGIGIHSDQMCMLERENRYLVHLALKQFKNYGLISLMNLKEKPYTNMKSNDFAYDIAPMLNGASRMDRIDLAIKLLTTDDKNECISLAGQIKDLNEERKRIQAEIFSEFDPTVNPDDKIITILDNDNKIGKGFAGLVASDFVSKYQKPTLVMGVIDVDYRGSFRSPSGFELNKFLRNIDEVNFVAGHSYAGGAGIPVAMINSFKHNANNQLSNFEFDDSIKYDIELSVKEIDQRLIEDVEEFTRINGQNIKEVKIKVVDLFVVEKKELGKIEKNTLKVICDNLTLMKFRTNKEYMDEFPVFQRVEVVGTLNLNRYFNKWKKQEVITSQLFMEDYKII